MDEVFLDYGLNRAGESFATGGHAVPTFVLSGLSKVAALPQMKAAWIACFAEGEALQRLEVISDTFLSMSAPIQYALPAWLSQRATLQEQIRERVAVNLASLDAILLRQKLVTRLEVEAGWYAVLRVPGLQPEEETALEPVIGARGGRSPRRFLWFFTGQGWLVVSLLTPSEEFAEGIEAVCTAFQGPLKESPCAKEDSSLLLILSCHSINALYKYRKWQI